LKAHRYRETTIRSYMDGLYSFFRFLTGKPIEEIKAEDVTRFNHDYILRNGYSISTQNQVISALKIFFKLNKLGKLNIEIERPRGEKKLPSVLTEEEVSALFQAISNKKHKTMLVLIFTCGLRRSEVINLKIPDVNSRLQVLEIRDSKGAKDRIIPITDDIIKFLQDYYREFRPRRWLFEGGKAGHPYSASSLQQVFTRAKEKSRINRKATLHTLRHSYTTWHLERGTDTRIIQELLGHASIKTTAKYEHVSRRLLRNLPNPFDNLKL